MAEAARAAGWPVPGPGRAAAPGRPEPPRRTGDATEGSRQALRLFEEPARLAGRVVQPGADLLHGLALPPGQVIDQRLQPGAHWTAHLLGTRQTQTTQATPHSPTSCFKKSAVTVYRG